MKQLLTAFVFTLLLAPLANAKKVSGVEIPEMFKTSSGTELMLNGAGVRSKFFMDLYVGTLYLTKTSDSGSEVIKSDEPMAIKLNIVSGMITSDKMIDAVDEGFENATNGNTAPIKAEMGQFLGAFKEEIKKGDIFDVVYIPGTGIELFKNGKQLDTVGGGMPFKEAVFGIWLSGKPAQKSLREEMLGDD